MSSLAKSTALILASLATAALAGTPFFDGDGYVNVIKSGEKVGCLDATGFVVDLDSCAKFSSDHEASTGRWQFNGDGFGCFIVDGGAHWQTLSCTDGGQPYAPATAGPYIANYNTGKLDWFLFEKDRQVALESGKGSVRAQLEWVAVDPSGPAPPPKPFEGPLGYITWNVDGRAKGCVARNGGPTSLDKCELWNTAHEDSQWIFKNAHNKGCGFFEYQGQDNVGDILACDATGRQISVDTRGNKIVNPTTNETTFWYWKNQYADGLFDQMSEEQEAVAQKITLQWTQPNVTAV